MRADIDTLRDLGGLHDATIQEVRWRSAEKALRLVVNDMFSNFRELPEYPGPKSGSVTFVGVSSGTGETSPFAGVLRISGIDVASKDGRLHVRLGLSEPGSDLQFSCDDLQVEVLD